MTEQEPRIGVYVCDCGSNIAGVVNVPEVVAYARGLDKVVFAEEGRWSCSAEYLEGMKGSIQENGIKRVVIASCTPRTHEPLFKRAVKEAGVNPYLLEFVSIREQVSWVHMAEPGRATEKAKDLVRMGVAKAALLEEGEEVRLAVGTDALVIGGGMAGMTAAVNLADQGFSVHLVERNPELGGLLNRISRISFKHQETAASELVKAKAARVAERPNIDVYTQAIIESVEGYIGHYKVGLNVGGTKKEISISTIIVATGMEEIEPEGQFQYGNDPRVVTQLQLEDLMRGWENEGDRAELR